MILFSDISREYFAGESQDWEDSKEDSLRLLDLVAL
jgi:hypothetical protein